MADEARRFDPITADGADRRPPSGPPRWLPALAIMGVVGVVLVFLEVDSPPAPTVRTTTSTTASGVPVIELDGPPWWHRAYSDDVLADTTISGWEALPARLGIDWSYATEVGEGEVFLWGGRYNPDIQPTSLVFDTAAGELRTTAPLPGNACVTHAAFVVPMDREVLVLGSGGGCLGGLAYSLDEDTWTALDDLELFDPSTWGRLVWTGEALIDPFSGVGIVWATGEAVSVPDLPRPTGEWTGTRSLWTGDRVIAIAGGGIHSWTPGDSTWEVLESGPRTSDQISGAWTTEGLFVIGERGARFFDGEEWTDAPGLVWDGECYPSVLTSRRPLVSLCGGFFLWDEVAGGWVPVPPASVGHFMNLVEVGDTLYVFEDVVRRLVLRRTDTGEIAIPATLPIGPMLFEVPDGFEYVRHEGPERLPLGASGGRNVKWGLVMSHQSSGTECVVEVAVWPAGQPEDWPTGYEPGAEFEVPRWWDSTTPPLRGTLIAGESSSGVAVAVGPGALFGPMSILATCSNGSSPQEAAIEVAGGVWSPNEGWFHTQAPPRDTPVRWRYYLDNGYAQEGEQHLPAWPDQSRSVAARDRFLACVTSEIDGSGIVLDWLSMLVAEDGELLSLGYRALRPGARPPIAHLDDDVRRRCLASTGVGMWHFPPADSGS